MIPGSVTPLLLKSAAAGGLQIQRSLRFNSADSATLSRTPAVAGNRRTWTWSGWVKRVFFGQSFEYLFDAGTTDNFGFTNNSAYMYFGSGPGFKTASATFRDPSAWLHYLIHLDSTNATAEDRCQIWINGVRLTSWSSNPTISLNFEGTINSTVAHTFANAPGYSFMNTYLANVHFIDGQALTPSSFTETDATTGQLIPKTYTGSYGTNGFNLLFADNSSNTASTLGKDTSGLSNNWTPNNLSVTAGAGNDSLVDSPTNYGTDTGVGGTVRGNYATLNSAFGAVNGALNSPTNGNLDIAYTSGSQNFSPCTIPVSSGKWYFEGTLTGGSDSTVGIWKMPMTYGTLFYQNTNYRYYSNDGVIYNQSGSTGTTYNTYTVNNVIGVALDMDNGKIFFSKNGTWQGSSDPATGSNPAASGLTGTWAFAAQAGNIAGAAFATNFGQRPFAYTAPSGFKALNTQNLPAPLVTKSNTVFDVALYTGNGGTQSITGLAFSPDFVWLKARSGAFVHGLFDAVRGTGKGLNSNTTSAETTYDAVTSFNSDGFTNGGDFNGSATTYVAWAWDAGTSTVSNTQGSITSQVRANATAGFAVITGSTPASYVNFTFGHNLGIAPSLVIYKHTAVSGNWHVYHKSGGGNNYNLNSTAGPANSGTWSGLDPTSTLITIPSTIVSANSSAFVCYAFSPVVGYSSFGSYVGNGSSDGPTVYTGMRPRFLIYKRTDAADTVGWIMIDSARDPYNVATKYIVANGSTAEGTTNVVDFLSNGFKLRVPGADGNVSSGTYIYAAFAEAPLNYSRAR